MLRTRFDWRLIVPALLLSALGLLVIRSAAPALFLNQFVFWLAAVVIFLIVSFVDFRVFTSLYIPIYVFSLAFLVTPFLFGLHSRGAQRWLQFGQSTLQPSEIIKPLLIIVFAVIAGSAYRRKTLLLAASAILPLAVIFFQPDLGTMLVLFIGWLTIFLSRVRLRVFLPALLAFILLLLPIYKFVLRDYQRQRLESFLNPYSDPLGQGYHVIQSLIAVGSGEFFGRGLGHGTQSQLQFLPEHHTDFIFASLSEELGFVGAGLVLIFFLVLLYRIYRISQTTSSPVASAFCLSTMALLAFQIFVNVGMNMGLAPITGITLPFISYGGSSLISIGLTLGLVHSISRTIHSEQYLQIS